MKHAHHQSMWLHHIWSFLGSLLPFVQMRPKIVYSCDQQNKLFITPSDNRIWLCIGEVNALKVDGKLAKYVPHEMLPEKVVIVSYQLLGLHPATNLNNTDMKNDWQSYTIPEHSFTVPGHLVQAINPTISMRDMAQPYYLLESSFLVVLTASLMSYLTASDLK